MCRLILKGVLNMNTTFDFPKCEIADRFFAVVYMLVGYCFIYVFTGANDTIALSMFTVLYAVVVLCYLWAKEVRPPAESWFWLAVVLAIGIPFGFYSILYVLQILALMATAAYWTLSASGRLLQGGKTSQWVFFDFWNAVAMVPFGNFCQVRVLTKAQSAPTEEKKENHIGAILLGVVLTIPALIIILPLLASADAGFQLMVGGIVEYIQVHMFIILIRVVLAIPVSEYLFGLVFGGIHGRNADRIQTEKLQETGKKIRKVSDTAVCTALFVICLIYLLFVSLQGSYLFSAFQGKIPQGFTYSEYARRGFFELCQIGAWNLVFLGCAELFSRSGSRRHRGLGRLFVLLSVFTLFLIGTAVSKMGMYISVYGLTVYRILPLTFMLWMAVVFMLIILRQKKVFPMIRICVLTGAVMFCLLCVFPIGAWVELYNTWARGMGYIV